MTLRDGRVTGTIVALGLGAVVWMVIAWSGPLRAKAVEVGLARETLVKVLDHWKAGGGIDDLRKSRPEIVVQEPLWSRGGRLMEYTLVNAEGRPEDANWYCEVQLTLEPAPGGKPGKKNVTYVVGTDPVLTVFHAIL